MIKLHANFAEIDYSCVMDMITMIAVKTHGFFMMKLNVMVAHIVT